MSAPVPATGAELPDLFADAHRGEDVVTPGGVVFAGGVTGGAWAAAALGSATVPLHTRADISPSALAAGVLTAGTASDAERWAGQLLAARGRVIVLDYGHVADEAAHWADEPAVTLTELWDAAATARAASLVRSVYEMVREQFAAARPVEGPVEDAAEDTPTLQRLAAAMTDVPAAVAVERPALPELTDVQLENVRRLFGLTVGQLAELLGVTERQAHRYLRDGLPPNRSAVVDALVAAGLTVIGGLGTEGAQRWLLSGSPSPAHLALTGRTAELRQRAEALRDSPVT